MKIITLIVGFLQTNCYLVFDEKTRKALVIDPGGDCPEIVKTIEKEKLKVKYIIITHHHPDHTLCAEVLRQKTGAKIISGKNFPSEIKVQDLTFKILSTPGHTEDSISLWEEKEKVLFSGDTLFKNGYGRTDLPGGNFKQLKESLKKLFQLPPETIVYPGHGPKTFISQEKPPD